MAKTGPLFLRTFLLKRPARGMGGCTQLVAFPSPRSGWAELGAEIVVPFGVWTRNILPAGMILFCEEIEV